MNAKPGTDRLIDTYLSMDHFERHRATWLSRRKQLDIELTIASATPTET